MAKNDIKVLFAKLHDDYKISASELGRLVPTLGEPCVQRWVHEGRELYQNQGLDRLISALLK